VPKTLGSNEATEQKTDGSSHRELSEMIDAGRSFSGNERNCVFLNTGDGRFATLSAASGLDFPDDGRAVAMSDWDQDGDLDLWISNRNAPRLRLMRNEVASGNHFLSLELTGNGRTTSRDAIGARVEVILGGSHSGKKLVMSLRAGEGFLSQSGKALHFGLGQAGELEKVTIRWPDGQEEVLTNLLVDHRYRIRQGESRAEPVPKREGVDLKQASGKSATVSASAGIRVPVVTLLKPPRINLSRKDGSQVNNEGRHQLIHLWASWCPDCLSEMKELSQQAGSLRAAGIEVLALNIDDLGDEKIPASQAGSLLAELKFPFPATKATRPLVEALQGFHDSLVGLNRPLPVPTSFLIDPRGRLSVIYKGPVKVDQVIADLGHSDGGLEERMKGAAVLPGSMISHPLARKRIREQEARIQLRFGRVLQGAGDKEAAIYHYSSALRLDSEAAGVARQLGELYYSNQQWQEAVLAFKKALLVNPKDAEAHRLMAQLMDRLGRKEETRKHFESALENDSRNVLAHFGFAAFLEKSNEVASAVRHYRKGLAIQPGNHLAKNNLAWILVTSSDESVRDPEAGLGLARELNVATGDRVPNILDTLSAAEASVGNFEEAARIAQRAMQLTKGDRAQQMIEDLGKRLKLYNDRKPFIQNK
jgi:tetratricopeptide (TPR) repeat protein